jgi:ABC-type Fe3+ transport system substrate-binding protein
MGAGIAMTDGCGPSGSKANSVDEAVEWARKNLPNSTADIIKAASREGRLTLTMLNQGGNTDILKNLIQGFNKRYPFIAVDSTAQSTLQLLNKFNAELNAKKGTTDYINFPGNLHTTGLLEKQGAILPFVISQDAAFPASAKRSGLWYAWRIEHAATAYRKGALSPEELKLIRTFEGLGDSRFKNRIAIGNIPNSTTASGCYVLMYKSDPRLWAGLVANKPRVKTSGPALVDGLLAGEHDIAVLAGSVAFIGAAHSGAPLEFGVSSPYPPVYTPGGISSLAPHPNAAKIWQDWVMSVEGQRILVAASGLGSSRTDLGVKAWSEQQSWYFKDPAGQMEIDWDDFAQKESDMVARFGKDLQKG